MRESAVVVIGTAREAAAIEPLLAASGGRIVARWARGAPAVVHGASRIIARVGARPAAMVVVAPHDASPRSAVLAPVIGGVPVALVRTCTDGDSAAWAKTVMTTLADRPRDAVSPLWVVLSEWEERYLHRARRFASAIAAGAGSSRRVRRWFASELNGIDLLERLDVGPRWISYFGHANPQGLAGYFGLTARHFVSRADAQPTGIFWCWSCRSLSRAPGGRSFGEALVDCGRVAAFVGSIAPVRTEPNARLAALACAMIRSGPHVRTVADLLRHLDAAVMSTADVELHRAWRSYRLVGNPLQPL